MFTEILPCNKFSANQMHKYVMGYNFLAIRLDTCRGCSTGTDPINDSTTLGSLQKLWIRDENIKKRAKMLGRLHLPNRTKYMPDCLDQNPDLTWGQDDFLHKTGNYCAN